MFDVRFPSFVSGTSDIVVNNEFELRNAVNNAVKPIVIALNCDIALTAPLVISVNKDITLTSIKTSGFFKLVGGNRASASNEHNYPEAVITVEGGAVLRLDCIAVTCVGYTWNKIVRVDVCGTLILYNGELSGNNFGDGVVNSGMFEMYGGKISNNNAQAGYGGGVYNSEYGTFSMSGGEISNNIGFGVYNRRVLDRSGSFELSGGVIRNNGGGVQNSGIFSMSGGEISNNVGENGGGVQNSGVFSMSGGKISNNQAVKGGGVYNYPIGNFSLSGKGVISNNEAEVGGGVYNAGIFNRCDGVISDNTAAQYDNVCSPNGVGELPDGNGGSSDENNELSDMNGFSLKDIVVITCVGVTVVVVSVVGVLFLYLQKRKSCLASKKT